MFFETECVMAVQGHSRSLILETNQKRVCNFLLVINNNLGLSCFVSEILQVFSENSDPTLFKPNFGLLMLGLRGAKSLS